jgi:predicted acyltransferase
MKVATLSTVYPPLHFSARVSASTALPLHPPRLRSLDAYRGLIMLTYLAGSIFKSLVGHPRWNWLAVQNEHAAWRGATYWDLVQPSFEFMVGVAMPIAFARRVERGHSWARRFCKVVLRVMSLVLIAFALDHIGELRVQTGFMRALPQIAFGYFCAFFLLGRSFRVQALAAAAILVSYNLLWMFNPWNGPGGPWAQGNQNIGSAFDLWMVGRNYPECYVAMNAIPSTANIIFGVMAGKLLLTEIEDWKKTLILLAAGVGGIALGLAVSPWLPIIKRIWTPSFAVFSGGCTTLALLLFYWIIEVVGWRRWAFPLVVVGANLIAAYVLANLLNNWFIEGPGRSWILWLRQPFGMWNIVVEHVYFMCLAWGVLYGLYRRGIFLRV